MIPWFGMPFVRRFLSSNRSFPATLSRSSCSAHECLAGVAKTRKDNLAIGVRKQVCDGHETGAMPAPPGHMAERNTGLNERCRRCPGKRGTTPVTRCTCGCRARTSLTLPSRRSSTNGGKWRFTSPCAASPPGLCSSEMASSRWSSTSSITTSSCALAMAGASAHDNRRPAQERLADRAHSASQPRQRPGHSAGGVHRLLPSAQETIARSRPNDRARSVAYPELPS